MTRASAPATVKRTGGGDYQFVVATFGLTFASVHIPPLREIAEGELFLPGSEFLLAAFLILSRARDLGQSNRSFFARFVSGFPPSILSVTNCRKLRRL